MEAYSLLVNLRKGMQSSSEQPSVGEERHVTTLITAAKETTGKLEYVGKKPIRAECRTNKLKPGNRTRDTLVGGDCSHHCSLIL